MANAVIFLLFVSAIFFHKIEQFWILFPKSFKKCFDLKSFFKNLISFYTILHLLYLEKFFPEKLNV